MNHMGILRLAPLLLASAMPLLAQRPAGAPPRVPAAASLIRETDLRRDLFILAGPGMRGREAGTPDELRASMWLAEQMRRIRVVPFGEDSSWFQWFNMRRTVVSTMAS